MTTRTMPHATHREPFIRAFPEPPLKVEQAHQLLSFLRNATDEEREEYEAHNGPLELTRIPRPWIPTTCHHDPDLYRDLMTWLVDVAEWLTREYAWAVTRVIPPCWLAHPHIVNELAVLADQRRTASRALDSTPLEEWHRYTLPMFLDRMTTRLADSCQNDHKAMPASHLHTKHVNAKPGTLAAIDTVAAQLEHDHQPEPAFGAFRPHIVPPLITTPDGLVDPSTGEFITPDDEY